MSNPLFFFIYLVIDLYMFLLIIYVILSWLFALNILGAKNPLAQNISYSLFKIFEPAVRKIRPYVPKISGVDLSFLALIILVQVVSYTVGWIEYKLMMI